MARGAQKPTDKRLKSPDTSDGFLDSLTLGYLKEMVLHAHGNHPDRFMVGPGNARVDHGRLESLLKICNEARRKVAHNRQIPKDSFGNYQRDVTELLELLHFDVDKVLAGVERRRQDLATGGAFP